MKGNEGVKFHIKGGEVFVTESSEKAYRVLEGSILVYLMPCSDGEYGRRMFLGEMAEGTVIPGFASDSDQTGSWRFGFVALEQAEFEEMPKGADEEVRLYFAGAVNLKLTDDQSFEDALIELYSLNEVTEEGYLYKLKQGIEDTRELSLNMIRDVFRKKSFNREGAEAPTGHLLYDCAAFLCARERIEIASREKIKQSAGSAYDLRDIARVSHFTIREIVLQNKWYKRDYGAFIAFSEEGGRPWCLIPAGPGRYRAYDAKTGELIKVDRDFAGSLRPGAVMFYRPFPNEKITPGKLILFGMQKVYISDVIRLIVLAAIGVMVGLLISRLNEFTFDIFIPLGNAEGLVQLGAVILSCALGNVAFTIVKNLSSFRAMNSMEYAVQSAVIDRLFSLPESFFRYRSACCREWKTVISFVSAYLLISSRIPGI